MKNSHRLIIFALTAQLLLLSGCTEPSPINNPPSAPSAQPSSSSTPANDPEQKCLGDLKKLIDSKGTYKIIDSQLSTFKASSLVAKSTALSTQLQSFLTKANECQKVKNSEKSKSIVEQLTNLIKLTSPLSDSKAISTVEFNQAIGATKLDSPELEGGDEQDQLARRFIKYSENKLKEISNSIINTDSQNPPINPNNPDLLKTINDLKVKVEELEKKIGERDKKIDELEKKIGELINTSLEQQKKDSKLGQQNTFISSIFSWGVPLVILSLIVYGISKGWFRSLQDSFGLSKRSSVPNNNISSKQGTESPRQRGLASKGGSSNTGKDQKKISKPNSGSNIDNFSDKSQELPAINEQDIPSSSNESQSVSTRQTQIPKTSPSGIDPYQQRPSTQPPQQLTYDLAVQYYQDVNYHSILHRYTKGYYSATIDSLTANRKYSVNPLELVESQDYNGLFWIVKTSDNILLLFPNPQMRIDQSRIQGIKYFFNNNFHDSSYRACQARPAEMGNENGKWIMQQKGQINFVY